MKSRQNYKNGRSQAGYTFVELMMAVAIFAVGVTGVVAMQTVTVSSNRHAKELAVASQLARSWQDRLAIDANLWGGRHTWPLTQTTWAQQVDGGNNATWIIPAQLPASGAPIFGPAAASRGEPVAATGDDVYYCTHIRLTKLLDLPESGLIRSEVRVFWPKGPEAYNGKYCEADPATIGALTDQFHFVYSASALRQTPSF